MFRSHVIEIDGAFVGVAISSDAGYRFVAIDARLNGLNTMIHASLADLHRRARRRFRSGIDNTTHGVAEETQGQPS
jgi:hypothetical protein